jgi:hypothetical protein
MEVNDVGREEKCMQGGEELILVTRVGVGANYGINVRSLVHYTIFRH